ncbi:MAG: type I CRISPR-associated protein Cas8a1/Csx8 [Sarcina sp.]
MKTLIDEGVFDSMVETSEWRYNAAIVGLIKYFDFLYSKGLEEKEDLYEIDDDCLKYNSKMITEKRYLLFVERFFESAMHHRVAESILVSDEITEEQATLVNEKLKANTVMKSVFGKLTYSEESKNALLKLIEENRLKLIKETYRRGKSLYCNFINENLLLSESNKTCRIVNYCTDMAKKGKSLGYNWDSSTYVFEDDIIFDFIPFAFSKSYEAFFINNNFSIAELLKSNSLIANSENPRSTLFNELKNSSEFIDFDVETIVKVRDKSYYETLYIRKEAIAIFNKIDNYKGLQFVYRDGKDPRFMEKEIVEAILNKRKLDSIIEMLLKSVNNYSYNIKSLIEVNKLIYGGDSEMDSKMKGAYASGKAVVKALEENKLNSYKQKLISAVTFNDKNRFCEILLQLSSYSGVVFNFAYDLFEDFEENKNLAYTFINALSKEKNKDIKGGNADGK